MRTGAAQGVLARLRRTILHEREVQRTDGELLSLYLTRQDEPAFEAIVRRHGPMVLGVCRRTLGSQADAEDAFQATFLVLVRKAASVRPREQVANWLYGVAYRISLKARAAAAKRRLKEKKAVERGKADRSDDSSSDWLPLLDREIHLLPERYRVPIVLCELEGKTHQEAARQMGWPVGTLSGRLSRARTLLARRMARYGAVPSFAALALTPEVVSAALASTTTKAALAYSMGKIGASIHVLALAEGMMKTMLLARLKAAVAVLLLAVSFGAAFALGTPEKEAGPVAIQDEALPRKDAAADPDEKILRDYVEELRAAVKKPADAMHIYRLVIDQRFTKTLHWVARRGDDGLVVELIRTYYGPKNPDRGGTSLTWAAWLNDARAVEILLDRGVKVNGTDDEGRTALHEAVRWGPHITKMLVDKGADVNARTKKGVTPVMEAAAESAEALPLLLNENADVNARDAEGKTALMYAAEKGRLASARALLAEGADVRRKDTKGRTALDLVRPSDDYLPGVVTPERLKEYQERATRDAETLRVLLKRAGG